MSYLRGSDVAWVKIQDIWYMLKKYLANQSQNLKRMPCNFHVWGIHHKAPTQSLRAGPSESVGNRIFAYFKLGWTRYQLCSIFLLYRHYLFWLHFVFANYIQYSTFGQPFLLSLIWCTGSGLHSAHNQWDARSCMQQWEEQNSNRRRKNWGGYCKKVRRGIMQ